jgi:hypothetical protein
MPPSGFVSIQMPAREVGIPVPQQMHCHGWSGGPPLPPRYRRAKNRQRDTRLALCWYGPKSHTRNETLAHAPFTTLQYGRERHLTATYPYPCQGDLNCQEGALSESPGILCNHLAQCYGIRQKEHMFHTTRKRRAMMVDRANLHCLSRAWRLTRVIAGVFHARRHRRQCTVTTTG